MLLPPINMNSWSDTFQSVRCTYNHSSVEFSDYLLFPKKTNNIGTTTADIHYFNPTY